MAVLSLPLTFSNSFWSEDYRKGLEVLYAELEKVRRRVHSRGALALIAYGGAANAGYCREH